MFPYGPSTSIISASICAKRGSSTTALATPATCAGSVSGIDIASSAPTAAATPFSRPRCSSTGSAPPASSRCSSRAMPRASTAAVTLPSPNRSRICHTTCRIIIAPAFSTRSGRSVKRRAIVAPSSSGSNPVAFTRWLTIFPPRGPSVNDSSRASVSNPRRIGSRHSAPNTTDGTRSERAAEPPAEDRERVGMAQPFSAPSVMPLTK